MQSTSLGSLSRIRTRLLDSFRNVPSGMLSPGSFSYWLVMWRNGSSDWRDGPGQAQGTKWLHRHIPWWSLELHLVEASFLSLGSCPCSSACFGLIMLRSRLLICQNSDLRVLKTHFMFSSIQPSRVLRIYSLTRESFPAGIHGCYGSTDLRVPVLW